MSGFGMYAAESRNVGKTLEHGSYGTSMFTVKHRKTHELKLGRRRSVRVRVSDPYGLEEWQALFSMGT